MKRFAPRATYVLVVLLLHACAGKPPVLPPPAPPASAAETDLTLFLIGDAGKPKAGGDPVLLALSERIQGTPGEAFVVFLGDNIYDYGLPAEDAEDRKEMERRLLDQIQAVGGTKARAIFVPGNHDWSNSGEGGLEAIRRQGEFIRQHGYDGRVIMLPEKGCPGPSVFDVGERLRLIALDTEWWLHTRTKPGPDECAPGTEEAVVDALRENLARTGDRYAVVVAHHPLLSSASHGGYFNWQDHLFPLTREWG
ncbi:MAG: metallophosphoesterase family protein, partial [Vicinamibacteria bacterium]